jgi:hypothetical protein
MLKGKKKGFSRKSKTTSGLTEANEKRTAKPRLGVDFHMCLLVKDMSFS